MIQEKSWYRAVMKISGVYNSMINLCCVALLTIQVICILIMVSGRYVLHRIPQWTEQFALFCMVWFAMFSIALAVRDDSHVKMEIIDSLISPKVLLYFKLFGNICTAVFGYVMVYYGIGMTTLTWSTKLSAFRVPTGLMYFSAVAGGVFMITNAVVYCIEMFARFYDNGRQKEEGNEY